VLPPLHLVPAMAEPAMSQSCAICFNPLQWPMVMCSGSGVEAVSVWLRTPHPRAVLPDSAHIWHFECMEAWFRSRLAEGQHDPPGCPVCRCNISNSAVLLVEGGQIRAVPEPAWNEPESVASPRSLQGSERAFTSSSSEAPSDAFTLATLQKAEREWLGLVDECGRWFRCCATGQRCWILAASLAHRMDEEVYSEDQLVKELQESAYGLGWFGFERTRPIFEIFWEPPAASAPAQWWVSCVSAGLGCDCGAQKRGADVAYYRWSRVEEDVIFSWVQALHLLQLRPAEMYPSFDPHANRHEVSSPWMQVTAVLQALQRQVSGAGLADLTPHEFLWQCRRCQDSHGMPMCEVHTGRGADGQAVHWVRLTTIGWRRRARGA